MINFIKNVLSSSTIQVTVYKMLAMMLDKRNSIPQGSTLSFTLFLICINDIEKSISNHVKCTLFVDDFMKNFIYFAAMNFLPYNHCYKNHSITYTNGP